MGITYNGQVLANEIISKIIIYVNKYPMHNLALFFLLQLFFYEGAGGIEKPKVLRTRLAVSSHPSRAPSATSHYQGSDFHISAKIWELATLRHPNFLTPHGKSRKLHSLVVAMFKDNIYRNLNGVKSVYEFLILNRIILPLQK